MPIYQTTSYVFDDPQQAADLFALQTFGNIYTRIGNPTTAAFEERVASLEGGIGGLAAASGMSAQLISVLTVCEAGDHLIANRSLYGGTFTQFDVTLRRMGIDTTFVDTNDLSAHRVGHHRQDPTRLWRDDRQSRRRGTRHRTDGRAGPWPRVAAVHRQHIRHSCPVPPDRPRCRRDRALGDQIHWRARGSDRRGDRRERGRSRGTTGASGQSSSRLRRIMT